MFLFKCVCVCVCVCVCAACCRSPSVQHSRSSLSGTVQTPVHHWGCCHTGNTHTHTHTLDGSSTEISNWWVKILFPPFLIWNPHCSWPGRLRLTGRANILLLEGCWFNSPGLHIEVSLGKILLVLHGSRHHQRVNVLLSVILDRRVW